MTQLTNTIQNSVLAGLTGQAPHGVVHAIQTASAQTGVDFAYLVQQAGAESSFNPAAKAKTSSATGLYQFIESTWMSMVEKYGDKYGIETEGKSKKEILALRNDPEASSFMAAEFAGENEQFLKDHWGGDVGSTELYFAHFLGAGSAAAFLKERDHNPSQQAALLFPKAAQSNRAVFYDSAGRAKSLDEVYAFFDKKFQIKNEAMPQTDIRVASAPQGTQDIALTLLGDTEQKPRNNSSLYAVHDYTPKARTPHKALPYYSLVSTPVEVMLLAQLDAPLKGSDAAERDIFSLFSRGRSFNN